MENTKTNQGSKKTNGKSKAAAPEKSKKLLSIKEFLIGSPIRKERQAAIKIKFDENEFHSRSEWEKLIEKL